MRETPETQRGETRGGGGARRALSRKYLGQITDKCGSDDEKGKRSASDSSSYSFSPPLCIYVPTAVIMNTGAHIFVAYRKVSVISRLIFFETKRRLLLFRGGEVRERAGGAVDESHHDN